MLGGRPSTFCGLMPDLLGESSVGGTLEMSEIRDLQPK